MTTRPNQTTRIGENQLPFVEQSTSLLKLTGDEFATNRESYFALLESETAQIGTNLTNNNGVTFSTDTDLVVKAVNVAQFDGVNQSLSVPTEASVQVGTGSFMAHVEFKDLSPASSETLFSYGDEGTGEQFYRIFKFSDGTIRAGISDGTTEINIDTIPNATIQFFDGNWHSIDLIVDRTNNLMYLFIDGEIPETNAASPIPRDISGVTGTLDNAGTKLNLGVREVATVQGLFFSGQLSNFHLIKAIDYNALNVLNTGFREAVHQGTGLTFLAEGTTRLNSRWFSNDNTDGNYVTTVINVDQGYYDLQAIATTVQGQAINQYLIDGEEIASFDQYSASVVNNIRFEKKNIKLTRGKHVLTIKANGQNPSANAFTIGNQFVNLIKRDGPNEGGATSAFILGDEIQEEGNPFSALGISPNVIYLNLWRGLGDADGQFCQGTIFLKRGLYNFDLIYREANLNGIVDIWIGGKKVIDQLDTYNAVLIENVFESRQVFLEGGKTEIKIQVNGKNASSSNFRYQLNAMRLELISGKSEVDKTQIWGVDQDKLQEVGTQGSFSIQNPARFNFESSASAANSNDGDKFVYKRYFSGGLYKCRLIYWETAGSGIMDIGIDGDSTKLFNQLDTYGTPTVNSIPIETIVEIPRGIRDVTFLVNGKNASSADFRFVWQAMFFERIQELEDVENDDNSDPTQGAYVPLGIKSIRQDVSNVALEMSAVDIKVYSAIEIYYKGRSNAAQSIQLRINDNSSSNYYQNGYRSTTSLVNTDTGPTTAFTLLDNVVVPAANRIFSGKITINLDELDFGGFNGMHSGGGAVDGAMAHHLYINGFGSWNPTLKIDFRLSASSYQNLSFFVYGIKR